MPDDDEAIPAFLKRHDTPEQRARLKRLTHRLARPRIKNPPKRNLRRATGLGPIFGAKVVQR